MTEIKHQYQPRSIRFLEVFQLNNTTFKFYSISNRRDVADTKNIEAVKGCARQWYDNMHAGTLDTYAMAILIVHEVQEGVMGIISRWIDENMAQTHVYLSHEQQAKSFQLFSEEGIHTCVWELAVLWHERNAWVKHILMRAKNPDWKNYLNETLNTIV